MKKPIKKRLILGSIAAAGVAGAAGFGYDTYSDYIDGDEETVEEIVAKLPENLKTEAINEAIGLGIFKIAKLGKEQVVYATEAMRKKLADFYESGIKPVLADVKEDTFNLDPSKLERMITKKTRAIIPVHYGGQPCDMDPIQKIARKYRLKIIEDAAHAVPAKYKGRMVGTLGDLTCFSFYATKPVTTGEGGMITTKSGSYAGKIRLLRLHGLDKDAWGRRNEGAPWKYRISTIGHKYNLSDVQSAIGVMHLQRCWRDCQKRRYIANYYSRMLQDIDEIETPFVKKDVHHAWHLYTIKLKTNRLKINRDEFFKALKRKGIGASVFYIPLHMHPFYKKRFGFKKDDFPVAGSLSGRILSLPIYPGLGSNPNLGL